MSNSSRQLSTAQRTMIASTLLGGGASVLSQWSGYQSGEISVSQLSQKALIDATKAGLAGGLASAVGGAMAGRPVLSMATVLLGGVAALHLMDAVNKEHHE